MKLEYLDIRFQLVFLFFQKMGRQGERDPSRLFSPYPICVSYDLIIPDTLDRSWVLGCCGGCQFNSVIVFEIIWLYFLLFFYSSTVYHAGDVYRLLSIYKAYGSRALETELWVVVYSLIHILFSPWYCSAVLRGENQYHKISKHVLYLTADDNTHKAHSTSPFLSFFLLFFLFLFLSSFSSPVS